MRRLAAALLVLTAVTAAAQTQTFEVASVKRNISGTGNYDVRNQPGRVTFVNMTLRELIRGVYRLPSYQMVENGEAWITTDRWDILAKAADEAPIERMIVMMRALLADRFTLVTHRETREMPTYGLVLSRPDGAFGPALHRSTLDCVAQSNLCGVIAENGRFKATGRTMNDLARNLAPMAQRLVEDKTGVPGIFDLEFTWNDTDGPSLFTALQEQLGLRLDSQRGPVDVLVIDSAQRPTED